MICEGRSVMSSRIKCTCACGSLEQCTMCRDVVSQAGVLCEMTTRADETPPPPKPKPKGRDVNQAPKHSGVQSIFTATRPDDTATHTKTYASRPSLDFSESRIIMHETTFSPAGHQAVGSFLPSLKPPRLLIIALDCPVTIQ